MKGLSLIYGVILVCSILLPVIYLILLKNNIDKKGLAVFISIIIINLGYFLLSSSKTLSLAIHANRLSYLGSVILLVSMYLIVNEFCNIKGRKFLDCFVIVVSVIALTLSLTGGSSIKLYYQSVDIIIENGATQLVKVYGPLHHIYGFYVFIMFIVMIATVIYSIIKKKVISSVNPIILLLLVTENMIVWYIEKLLSVEMELLAVSYITTGGIFILLFKNNDVYEKMNNINKEIKTVEEVIKIWKDKYNLTKRELDIVNCLIENKARSKIAEELFISEHTVKKHTTHIYEKLDITSRNDLLYKLNEELTQQ